MFGQILLIVELLVATTLVSAFITACSARNKSFLLELILWFGFLIFAAAPWAALLFNILFYYRLYTPFEIIYKFILIAGAVFVLVTIWIIRRGFKRPAENATGRIAGRWNLLKLGIPCVIACVCFALIFYLWDIRIQDKISSLKAEAACIAEELAPKTVTDEQNAYLLYQKAAKLLDEKDRQTGVVGNWQQKMNDWYSEAENTGIINKDVLPFLKVNSDIIQLLREAGDKGYFNYNNKDKTPAFYYKNDHCCYLLKALSRILFLSAWVNANNGHLQDVIQDLNAIIAILKYLLTYPSWHDPLLIGNTEAMVFFSIKLMISGNLLKNDDICNLRNGREINCWNQYQRSIKLDYASDLYWLGQGYDKYHSTSPYYLAEPFYNVFLWGKHYAEYQSKITDKYQISTFSNYLAFMAYYNKRMAYGNSENVSTHLLSSVFSYIPKSTAIADAEHGILLLLKAACQYKKKYGGFPETLEKLSPEFLPAMPVDPFSGQGFKYIRTKDNKITIYSVGPDMSDDLGADFDAKTKKGDICLTIGG
ncbi:MAG: hypothetical protein HZA50_01755 [Planctomycetes bacterium]|nr:hypothetical protein [Planctomycetota bacterium]